jgi:hypothetical protein
MGVALDRMPRALSTSIETSRPHPLGRARWTYVTTIQVSRESSLFYECNIA